MARRLAAIMFTDIAGYTSLSQRDEPAALRLLQDQERLVRGLLEIHQGRLVKSIGDGLLLEFPDALDAVACAVDLQRHIRERNARERPPELKVRIGVHLGDVEGVGPDILGDAVNVASRIEPLAEPGGVCLTEPVYGLVRNKGGFQFEKLGPKTLKGVHDPVEVYRAVLPSGDATFPSAREAGVPRLAVLPLTNISPDPKDEYFADGLTEELITVLSQLEGLQVIARTSVVQYKTVPKPIAQIGAELGVTSVLEGSVRKADGQLRIAIQLIDVGSQGHLWAETYDRRLEDVFAVQTEVAKQVAEVLRVKLRPAQETRPELVPSVRPDSYLAYLRGRSLLSSDWSEEIFRRAKQQFELAISLDPTNARAYSGLSDAIRLLGWGGYESSREAWEQESRAHAARAVELAPDLAEAHCSLGMILWDAWDYKGAAREIQLALSLNPSYSHAHRIFASILEDENRPEEALRELTLAEELDPRSMSALMEHQWLLFFLRRTDEQRMVAERIGKLAPDSRQYHSALGWCYLAESDYAAAIREFDREDQVRSEESNRFGHAVAYLLKGEEEEARNILGEMKRRGGRFASPADVATLHALLGDFDEAFEVLFGAVEAHLLSFQGFRFEPALAPLRKDPRFGQLLRRMNLA